MPKIQNGGLCKGFTTQVGFSTPKWKNLDSYVLLIAEKKYTTHTQDPRLNAPSVTLANTKKSGYHISKIKNAKNFKLEIMQKALAPKAPEDVKHGTAGDIKGGQIFTERR